MQLRCSKRRTRPCCSQTAFNWKLIFPRQNLWKIWLLHLLLWILKFKIQRRISLTRKPCKWSAKNGDRKKWTCRTKLLKSQSTTTSKRCRYLSSTKPSSCQTIITKSPFKSTSSWCKRFKAYAISRTAISSDLSTWKKSFRNNRRLKKKSEVSLTRSYKPNCLICNC